MPYYTVRRHPTLAGRWAVVHRVPGTDTLHIDADAATLAGAEREAAWLEAERGAVSHWHRHEQPRTQVNA